MWRVGLLQSWKAAEGRGAAAPSLVLHREMERYGGKTVRGIDEQEIEVCTFFKGTHRAFRREIITSASVGFLGVLLQ